MDPDSFLANLRADHETALSRLSSSKALYAHTRGEMEGTAVRRAVADEAAVLADLLESWVASTESGEAATVFAEIAEEARDHRDTLGPSDHDPPERLSRYAPLAEYETTSARAGGLLGRCLIAIASAEQAVGFFVGDADPTAANEFRSYRDDLESQLDDVLDLLGEVCGSTETQEAARSGADAVIEAAYEDYIETLESMGVKPKNVC